MQAFGAYALASVDLAAFAPQRRPGPSERTSLPAPGRARMLIGSLVRAVAKLGREAPDPRLPRLSRYPY